MVLCPPFGAFVEWYTAAYHWDDHAVNWDMRTAMIPRLPKFDQVVSTLIEDLYSRGLDKRVLLIVTGEFGRKPRLEFQDGRIVRDHWPGAMFILVSGGSMPMGQVIGATDHIGTAPSERNSIRMTCWRRSAGIWGLTIGLRFPSSLAGQSA